MKKIIIMGLVIIMSTVGCTSKNYDNLEDFYGELINKPFKEISIDKVKKDLKEFEYEYKLQEYTEEKSEYEELELSDYSDHIFKDGNGNTLDITFEEDSKEVSSVFYSHKEDDTNINIIHSDTSPSVGILGSNIEKQKEIISNLNLYKDLNEIVENYFKAVNNLYNKKNMTVEDLSNILNMDYENMDDEYDKGENSQYLFVSDFGENAYIDVETKGINVKNIKLKINLVEDSNYSLSLDATNEDEIYNEGPFILVTSISANHKSVYPKEEELIKSSTELFNLVFKNKDVNFYSENYTEESEKENTMLYVKFDKEKDENGISFESKRVVIEDDRPYDVDKTFKVKLKKGELLKINLEMENGKSLSIPIVITLQDLSNGEYIYSKSVDNTDENIFTTEKVDKDGEYEISVLMSDLEKYKFEISLVKE